MNRLLPDGPELISLERRDLAGLEDLRKVVKVKTATTRNEDGSFLEGKWNCQQSGGCGWNQIF